MQHTKHDEDPVIVIFIYLSAQIEQGQLSLSFDAICFPFCALQLTLS